MATLGYIFLGLIITVVVVAGWYLRMLRNAMRMM